VYRQWLNSHSLFPVCCRAKRDGNLETGLPLEICGRTGFHRLRAGPYGASHKDWMFDNEIDWVTQLDLRPKRREADREQASSESVKYKAEHMQIGLL
jgi:hypothetical protein